MNGIAIGKNEQKISSLTIKKKQMGQYYKAIILNDQTNKDDKETIKSWVISWDYNSGQKLMEHSWLGNDYVHALETLIHDNPSRVVWAGDYADNEIDTDYNLNSLADDDTKSKPKFDPSQIDKFLTYRYIINHTKGEYIDKTILPINDSYTDKETGETWDYYIHPLPLLTSEGNGRGGGDYHTNEEHLENMIGNWARDVIEVTNDINRADGMTLILINFIERRNIKTVEN